MKRIKKAEATGCAVTLVCEEDGREEKLNLLFDVITQNHQVPDLGAALDA